MAVGINSLERLHFSGKSEGSPTWSTKFIAFMQMEGYYENLIGIKDIITRPDSLPETTSNEQRAARDALQKECTIKVEEKKSQQ